MKVTIEIDDVEGLEQFKAEALAVLLGRLPKAEPADDKPVKAEAVEPAKQEARKPRAKAKPAPKAEPEKVEPKAEKVKAEEPKVKEEPPKVESEAPKVKGEPPKVESEPQKAKSEEPKIEPGTSKARTKEELVPLLREYCRSKVGGIDDVQSQFKELGLKALDEATPEQANTIAERLGL